MKTESRRRTITFTIVAFFAGLLIGWIVAGSETAPEPPTTSAIAPERSDLSPLEIAFENPVNPARKRPPDPVPSDLERFLEQAAAEEMLVVPVGALQKIRPISRGRLSDAMAEALALNEEEVRRVNRIFEEAEEKLNQSELERLEIVSVSDDEVIFHIPRNIEAGRELEQEFRQQFIEVLGDVDGAFFLSVHDYTYSSDLYFEEFGKIDRTVTFASQPDSNDRLRLRFSTESPYDQQRGSGPGVQSEGVSSMGFETYFSSDFPARPNSTYRSKFLIPLLPEPMRSQFEALEQATEDCAARKN